MTAHQLPKIPAGAEHVTCPACHTVGWRQLGTELTCPDCDVRAVPLADVVLVPLLNIPARDDRKDRR